MRARIAVVEKELQDAIMAARVGGPYRNDHIRRVARLRKELLDLKFVGVKPHRVVLSAVEAASAASIDATIPHWKLPVAKKSISKESIRARDFRLAREQMNRQPRPKKSVRIPTVRGFKVADAWPV